MSQSRVNPERVTREALLERARKIKWRTNTGKSYVSKLAKLLAKIDIAK